jgi:hypothetical protein
MLLLISYSEHGPESSKWNFITIVSESLEYVYATEVGLSEKCSHLSLSLSLTHTHTSGVEISGLFYSFIPGMEHRVPRGYKTKLKLYWIWVVDLAP